MIARTIPKPSRAPVAEALSPCTRCDGVMTPGLRYGPTPEPVAVRICWDCGAEDPPYRQVRAERHRFARCAWCSAQFEVHAFDRAPSACSLACADRMAAASRRRRSDGRAMRRERAS